MKILLTGASGFVGSALGVELGKRNNITAVARDARRLLSAAQTVVEVPDIATFTDWSSHLSGIDVVVHCAGLAHTQADEQAYYTVNTEATQRLSEACERAGVKRFIFLSSVKVLGERTGEQQRFHDNTPANPVDPYGKSKWLAEQQLLALHQRSGLEVVIIRPPLVYGPGVRANFQRLISIARLPCPLPFGSVSNRRDMVSLANLCDLIECCLSHPAAVGQTLLVSDGRPYSLAELLAGVRTVAGRRPCLFNVPVPLLRFAFILFRRKEMAGRLFDNLEVDIAETQRLLDWQPKYTLEDTLQKM